MIPAPLPAGRLHAGDFLARLDDRDLVYFLLNVGDGDAQLLLLPRFGPATARRAVIVDAGATRKVPALVRSLIDERLLAADGSTDVLGSIALVVATHPHSDHIRGMRELLDSFPERIAEFWDPGYFHTTANYIDMMTGVEQIPHLLYAQPSSGLRRWIGNVAVTVLSPSIQLKNRFDTYGTEINDASISLRFEFPASRVVQRDDERRLIGRGRTRALVLGADAQTLSWSYVLTDFPELHPSDSAAARAISAATGADLLRGHVLKISHHGSKHGVNLELIERIRPALTLVSSERGAGRYNFPHTVAQELIREAIEPTTSGTRPRSADHELNLFYTSDVDDTGRELGSFAVVVPPGGSRTVWRFTDPAGEAVDFSRALEWR
jgi:hypothetical protein